MGDPLHTLVLHRSEKTKNKVLSKMLDSSVCPVCHDYMFVPITTPCGHTYCYTCLKSWFISDTTNGELSCPECRTTMTNKPILNTVMQSWVNYIFELLSEKKAEDERFKTLNKSREEDILQYRKDKDAGQLFDSIFEMSATAVADESDDGIIRCSNCMWELEDDTNQCPNCSSRIRNSLPRSNIRSESTAQRGYNTDEYSEGEYEDIEEGLRRDEANRVQAGNPARTSFGLPEGYDEDDFSYSEDDENARQPAVPFHSENMRSRISLHDDEAEEDEIDEDEAEDGRNARHPEEEDDDEERDSDLDSFIVDDDEVIEEDNKHEIHDIPSNSDRDSDYERREDEFVEGDSLDENSDDKVSNNSESDRANLSNDEESDEETRSHKRQRRFRVVLDDDDD
ncbi:RING finger protein PSH1 [Nakaseomyces bracarensis]|uniref:RING finger protein PSH1 n=1 Tax=Nakaseomyces bracarensis TaxID=273131 RepID=A0ABR4NPF0_9SACH